MADLVVRAPNHLGDLVLALPAILRGGGDVLVVAHLAPLVAMSGAQGRVLPLRRGFQGFRAAARSLRAGRYARGIALTPAFSAALLFRVGGVRQVRGTATDGRTLLLSEPLDPRALRGRHRAVQYLDIMGDAAPALPEFPIFEPPCAEVDRWRARLGGGSRRVVGLAPGSRASSRRWPAERFRELATHLAAHGLAVAVFGAGDERALTAFVAGGAEGAADLGGATDLPMLAAALAACDLLVTNDSGPMHLAAAVGTRTVSLQGPADPAETAPLGPGHRLIVHAELSCVPCVKNECPRSGRGEFLDRAERECMWLITVDEVLEAVLEAVAAGEAPGAPGSE